MAVKLGRKITGNFRKAVEREINLYKDDHYLWHRHVTGVELNPHQVMWCNQMDTRGDAHLLIGSRRIRKSFTVAAYLMKAAATQAYSEVNVHSPALEQSKRNLRYMTEMVLNSEILMAYIDERLGEGIGKEHIEFMNGSTVGAKGQASSIDGLGATHQWLEEFDDMDWDTFLTRIYPTGSQIKDDHDYGTHTGCVRLVTGTIKGVGNIYKLEYPEKAGGFKFNVLPKLNAYHGIAFGIIPAQDIELARTVLFTPHQFARTYLVLYVESSTFYPDKWVRACGDTEYLPPVIPEDQDIEYIPKGDVCVGIDCGGAGATDDSSNWSITFTEKIGNRVFWLYSQEWDATANPGKIKTEMARLISYFRPISGFGDAFDTVFLFDLNVEVKNRGCTRIDVRQFDNKPGSQGWDNWYIKPIRFHGPAKDLMHKRMQKYIYAKFFRYPVIVDDDPRYAVLDKLIRQLGNVKAERSGAGYNKYSTLNNKLGDDIIDSCIASVWAQEEIRIHIAPYGGSVPQMEIGNRPHFEPLGNQFLHDLRKHAKKTDSNAYDFLRSD